MENMKTKEEILIKSKERFKNEPWDYIMFESEVDENRGWIKIESEEDLPNVDDNYWVRTHQGKIHTFDYLITDAYSANFFETHVTHYQPIVKPLPPLY